MIKTAFTVAKGYFFKYLTVGLAVLVVAAIIAFLLARHDAAVSSARADTAEARAKTLEGELAEARAAHVRDSESAAATEVVRQRGEDRQQRYIELAQKVGEIRNAPRDPVPYDAPDPHPELVQELSQGTDRVRAAEDRLRRLRRAPGTNAP